MFRTVFDVTFGHVKEQFSVSPDDRKGTLLAANLSSGRPQSEGARGKRKHRRSPDYEERFQSKESRFCTCAEKPCG
jgi:hypothetical protein